MHVHLHVLPRFVGDGFGLRRAKRLSVATREELDALAAACGDAWACSAKGQARWMRSQAARTGACARLKRETDCGRRGLRLTTIVRDATAHSRELKACISDTSLFGLPLRDEFELELSLDWRLPNLTDDGV